MKRANRLTLVAGMMPDAITSVAMAAAGLSVTSLPQRDRVTRPLKPVTL